MKSLTFIVLVSICTGCNRAEDFGEGVTREVTIGFYEGVPNVRSEVYKKGLLRVKALRYYDNGNPFYQTYYLPIDSFILITNRTFYRSGSLNSMSLRQAKIDTYTVASIEGKVTRSTNFFRDFYIYIVEFYPDGKIKTRYGLNNLDTAKTIESWYSSGVKQSIVVYKYTFSDTLKSIEWDSLGHEIRNVATTSMKKAKNGAP